MSAAKKTRSLPKPSRFTLAMLGPGVVLIAMGLGSGEYILWPYLVAQFGFGILWGALVGITLQYFVSNEAGRYTLATGDTVFSGLYKLFPLFPIWFIISTFLSFGWPGIIGTGAQITAHIFGAEDYKLTSIVLLIIIGLLLSLSSSVYNTMKFVQKLFVIIALPVLIYISVILINPEVLSELAIGFLGGGDNYFLFPAGLALSSFLGTIAFTGAGGNLVLAHSFYVQDEGLGMATYANSQITSKNQGNYEEKGEHFSITKQSVIDFKRWFSNVAREQLLTFWTIGITSIAFLSIISYALVYPFDGEQGLTFVFLQAERLGEVSSSLVGLLFLIIGSLFLFTTQLGVFETTSRIMTENLQLMSSSFKKRSRRSLFYFFLWAQIAFAIFITLLDIAAPLQILFLNTFFSAVSMLVLSGAVLWLNSSRMTMPKEIQPGIFRKIVLVISTIFFLIFVIVSLLG